MFTYFPKDQLVEALIEEWANFKELLESLSAQEWTLASSLPGWSIQDIVSHVLGTELGRSLGEAQPETPIDVAARPYVLNEIAAYNELWVEAFRSKTPFEMLAKVDDVIRRRREALFAMSQEDFDAPSWTPIGEDSYGRFMRIRLFDIWLHEQDIRDAAGQPGNETGAGADAALDEAERALGFLIGKRAQVPVGSGISLKLTGPVVRMFYVVVDERAKVVDKLDRPLSAGIELSSNLFVRLTGGRLDPTQSLDHITFTGDIALGKQVALNLKFTI